MRKNLLISSAASVFLLASSASYANDNAYYLHGTIGQGKIDAGGFVLDDSDTALGARFGWRFLPWLAVEAGYGQLGDYQLTCGGEVCPAIIFPRLEFESLELGLNARVPFGVSDVFGIARAGIHRFDVGFGGSETEPYYGLGVGYQFSPRFSLSLDYDRYETGSNVFDLDRLGVGLQLDF